MKRVAIVMVLSLAALLGCDDDNQTVIVEGLDCGLVRADLTGDWRVTFISGTRTLRNCDDPAVDDTVVSVGDAPLLFPGVLVVGSGGSAGFQVIGDGPDPSFTTELIANIEADSCLALVSVWDADDSAFFQCIGTFDPVALSIFTYCDSAEIDEDPDDAFFGATCDLNASLSARVDIFP